MSGGLCCLEELGADSVCEVLAALEAFGVWGGAFEEPPPKTRRKNPGFSFGGATGACDGNWGLRVATVGDGAVGSWNEGTGGRSRNVLALTNSCACALIFCSGWLLFFRKVL